MYQQDDLDGARGIINAILMVGVTYLLIATFIYFKVY